MPTLHDEVEARRKAIEHERTEQIIQQQNLVSGWTPPYIEEGTDVIWWPYADNTQTPYVGHAVRVRHRVLDIMLSVGGNPRTAVRHIDDPILVSNPSLKEAGAWDFSPRWKTEQAERKALTDKMDEILARQAVIENELNIKREEEAAPKLPDPKTLRNK